MSHFFLLFEGEKTEEKGIDATRIFAKNLFVLGELINGLVL
jgi:hypothetical protein